MIPIEYKDENGNVEIIWVRASMIDFINPLPNGMTDFHHGNKTKVTYSDSGEQWFFTSPEIIALRINNENIMITKS